MNHDLLRPPKQRRARGWILATLYNIVACLLLTGTAYAQAPCEDKGISTNPDAATNTELPIKRNGGPVLFDWRTSTYPVYLTAMPSGPDYSASYISPFYSSSSTYLLHFYLNKDMRPEDGWELIRQHMGNPIDAVLFDGYEIGIAYPAFVLYNRFTGMLRVFVALRQQQYSEAEVQLSFSDLFPKPAVLDLAQSTIAEPLRVLDNPTSEPVLSAVTQYLNDPTQWMYAEFAMLYDPCVCTFESIMQIKVFLISEASISLDGSTSGEIATIDDANNLHDVNIDGSSFSFGLDDAINAGKKAAETYRNYDELKTSTLGKIDAYNTYGPYITQEMQDKIDAQRLVKPAALNFFEQAVESVGFLKPALKAMPWVAAAVEVFSFFTGGGSEPAPPLEVRVSPMSIHTTSSFRGSITTRHDYRSLQFFTPGSNISSLPAPSEDPFDQPDLYPYYNEAMGLFNLLRRPKVVTYHGTGFESYSDGLGTWFLNIDHDTMAFKLSSSVDYVINSSAGFATDNPDIMASIVVEFDGPLVSGGAIALPVEDGLGFIESDRIYRTQYVPLGCLSDIALRIARYNESGSLSEREPGSFLNPTYRVYVKILARLEKTDVSSNSQNVLFVGKYLADLDGELEQQPDTYWASPWQNIASTATIGNGTSAVAHSSPMAVWNTISILPNVTVSSSAGTIHITGGETIEITSSTSYDTEILPSTEIRIDVPVACSTVAMPVGAEDLEDFCTSSEYRAGRGSFGKEGLGDAIVAGESRSSDVPLVLDLYPNPATTMLTIRYSAPHAGPVRIHLVDRFGRSIATVVEGHRTGARSIYHFDCQGIPNGLYHCVMETTDGRVVQPVVIAH